MEVAKATESKFKIMREISKEQAFLLACKFEADALLAYTEAKVSLGYTNDLEAYTDAKWLLVL